MRCECNAPTCRPCSVRSWARQLHERPYVIVDVETTGFGATAEIVQIGIVDGRGQDVFSSLVRPIKPIDELGQAFGVNKISNAMLAGAPTFCDIYDALQFWLSGHIIVAYNAAFDSRMIKQDCDLHHLPMPCGPWECAMAQYARYVGQPGKTSAYKTHRLQKACSDMGVSVAPTHRATADCIATWHLLRSLAD